MDLELHDFLSERVIRREFIKVFSGKELVPILSWGVNVLNIIYLIVNIRFS